MLVLNPQLQYAEKLEYVPRFLLRMTFAWDQLYLPEVLPALVHPFPLQAMLELDRCRLLWVTPTWSRLRFQDLIPALGRRFLLHLMLELARCRWLSVMPT
eukprot:GEMP01048918.1.p2 GENE.GEMP01048918.1~~GEMP01048918.1.p2  ORF type:complete len:100 (+),score=6.09 GEMP01048918.1:1215-1514(+)